MAKWKLSRLNFGKEEFTFTEGDEVTVGRGINNKIILSSLLVSRNHCVLSAKKDEVFLTDLKSSNGMYVGSKKIPSNIPTKLKTLDVIGFGLTSDSSFPNVNDNEKYVFKLTREESTLADRIVFQNDDDLKEELLALEMGFSIARVESNSPIIDLKPHLKRKIDQEKEIVHHQNNISASKPICNNKANLNIEPNSDAKPLSKKVKVETVENENLVTITSEEIEKEENDLELEAFNIKREYLSHDDDLIEIDSESDSDSEQWVMRLSQSSPGKPFIRASSISNRHIDTVKDYHKEDNSYSQMDDEIENNILPLVSDEVDQMNGEIENNILPLVREEVDEDEEYVTDLISIPLPPPDYMNENDDLFIKEKVLEPEAVPIPEVTSEKTDATTNQSKSNENQIPGNDVVDGYTSAIPAQPIQNRDIVELTHYNTEEKKLSHQIAPKRIARLMSPELDLTAKALRLTTSQHSEKTAKTKSSSRKNKKVSSSKRTITDSQKEERKRKLKAIAEKNKDQTEQSSVVSTTNDENKKSSNTINVKVTNTNRTMKMTEIPQEISEKAKQEAHIKTKSVDKQSEKQVINEKNHCELKSIILIDENDLHRETLNSKHNSKHKTRSKSPNGRVPVKSLKPLTDSEDSLVGKPLSKVTPLPQRKPKKSVRFSEAAPEVREFEIEPGNRMRKTSLIKTTLVDIQHRPMFSLEKISLMKVLRWNPRWLEEQVNNHLPPPILGHDIQPTPLFHIFENHNMYVQQVGDLLLMEVWENISLAYAKARQTPHSFLSMRISSLPPVPPPERCFDIFNITVDISIPNTEIRNLPNVGDVLLVSFGSENTRRFFFVHNVRCLPSPPRNIHSFYNLSLHATFTQKMSVLKPGDLITAVNLGRINNEMNLFEAMGYLASSPLCDAILRPEPRHFVPADVSSKDIRSPWTMTLNESQMRAVTSSVAAALGDRPCIQMIQGPPGTGKSSVICSILMTYFYDEKGNRHQNRGKVLICATSNAAVDGLVLKLLKIRQNLPKPQRFRMVRVGRLESMHERARDLSSQQLAQRDAQRPAPVNNGGAALEEVDLLNAKINKWKAAAADAKDPVRQAYCEGRVTALKKRRDMLQSGGGGGCCGAAEGGALRPEQLVAAERRIVEGADIIATTLASVHNHKIKGLKRRIALCVIDEAGQAIEPEALLPLTLDVTKITLVGDPQQLPGYICSQRAKSLGLGQSLFSRLSSCAEEWDHSAVQLLNTQYRMHQHIANYPNRAFYDEKVKDRPPARPKMPCAPYSVLGIASGDKGQATRGENEMEAWGVARVSAALSAALRRATLSPAVAVITPYLAQRDSIRRKLRTLLDPSDGSIEVNTVDSFQGQERDVVIVSLARSHGLGFVADAGRMNVLLTRARHALIICLNPRAVESNPQWRTLLRDAQDRHLYKALPNSMCQPTGPHSDEDILSYISSNQSKSRSNR